MTTTPPGPEAAALRIAFVPGVTIAKWTDRWEERRRDLPLAFVPVAEPDQADVLHAAAADVSFVRLPVDRQGLSVIRLYSEIAVVVVAADDALARADGVSLAELAGRALHAIDPADAHAVPNAVELVAAGVGAVVLPHSLARLHGRKGVVAVPVTDAPPTDVAIAWLADGTTPDIEEFVGIVRGRSANSSRATPTPPAEKPAKAAKAPRAPRPGSRRPPDRSRVQKSRKKRGR